MGDDIIIEKGKPGSRFYIIIEGTKKRKTNFCLIFLLDFFLLLFRYSSGL